MLKRLRDPTVRRQLAGEGIRFVLVGAANTGFTYLIYLLLLGSIRYELAYVISYAIGIVTSYFVNALLVFRQPLRRRSALAFPLVYVAQLLIGSLLLKLLVEWVRIPEAYAPLVVIAATLPVTFVLARVVLKLRPAPPDGY